MVKKMDQMIAKQHDDIADVDENPSHEEAPKHIDRDLVHDNNVKTLFSLVLQLTFAML